MLFYILFDSLFLLIFCKKTGICVCVTRCIMFRGCYTQRRFDIFRGYDCGMAYSMLLQIILDNTSAVEQILKDARGGVITGDGTVFQGYLFDDEQL